jgi:hypothetical protein
MRGLYFTHVYPHLIGAISIWGTQDEAKQYILPLVRTQKKIIRIMCNMPPRTHTAPLMHKLEILNLRVCAEMHPFVHIDTTKHINRPQHDHTYVPITDIHNHQTRYAKGHMYSPNVNTHKWSTTRQPNTIAHLTTKHNQIWNTLPSNLRSTTSLAIFKKQLKTYLLIEQQTEHTLRMTHGHHLA